MLAPILVRSVGVAAAAVFAGLAVVAGGVAVTGTNSLLPLLVAIVVATWYGGLVGGVSAVVLSVCFSPLVVAPSSRWFLLDADSHRLVLLIASAAVVVVLVHRQRATALAMAGIVDGVGDGVIVTDTAGRVTRLNRVAEELTGWTAAEAIGRQADDVFRVVARSTREPLESPIARVLRDGRRVSLTSDAVLVTRDGRDRPIDDSGAPLRDASGRLVGVVLAFRDDTARRSMEDELRAASERLRLAQSAGRMGTFEFRPDDGFVLCEPELLALYRTTPEAFDNTFAAWLSRIHPDDRARVERETLDVVRTGHYTRDYRVVLPGGEVRWIHSRGRLVTAPGGPRRVIGVNIDITDRKHAEIVAAENEMRFRTLADQAPVLIWMTGIDQGCTWVNRRWLEFTGRPMELDLGEGWVGAVHPDDRIPGRQAYGEAFERRERFSGEFRLRRHDGEYRWLRDEAVPLYDAAGRFEGYVGVCIEIHDERTLRERQAFLAGASRALGASLDYRETLARLAELAVAEMADGCAVDMLDAEGALERVAVAHRDPAKAALARDVVRRWPRTSATASGAARVIRSGQPVLNVDVTEETLIAAAENADHLAALRALGLRSSMILPLAARGRTLGAISFVLTSADRRYGTEDLAAAAELASRASMAIDNARLYDEAQEANRAKDDFLARLSHELRTPLNAIVGWTAMLRRFDDRERWARGLEVIDRNGRALTRIIEDLLDFSRNVRGGLTIEPVPMDLRDVVVTAVQSIEVIAQQKHIALDVAAAETCHVMGDAARLQQVVWNLLTNAVKFTPDGGRVRVGVHRVDDRVRLVVSDSGLGIPATLLPTVFDPFRQGDPNRTGSLGLGLAIVREVVQAHQGAVRAESDGDGRGSTFTVELPVLSLSAAQAG